MPLLNPFRFGAGAGAPAFSTPADISGLLAWWKADAGVTQSSGAVSAWADQSSNARSVTAAGSAQPTYSATGFDGTRAGITFDGTANILKSSAPFMYAAGGVLITITAKITGGQSGNRIIVGESGAAQANTTYFPLKTRNTQIETRANDDANFELFWIWFNSVLCDGAAHTCFIVDDGSGTCQAWLDGTSEAAQAYTHTRAGSTYTLDTFSIGGGFWGGGLGGPCAMILFELVIAPLAWVTTPNLASLQTYLKARGGTP